MSIQKVIMASSEKVKPLLKKIFPQQLLSNAKNKMLDKQLAGLISEGKEAFVRETYPDGINLIGLLRAQMGLGQSSRLLADMIENSKYPLSLYDFKLGSALMSSEDHTLDDKITDELKYNINLIHINPDEMKLLYTRMDAAAWKKRYNIAFWLWELEEIPESWKTYFPLLDEIWTPSEFISQSLRKVTDLPVTTIPYCVKAPTESQYTRTYFKLPEDKFLFLAMYDSNSTRERKNPMGVIRAFKKAFSPDDKNVGLVLKVNNAREEDMTLLKGMLKDYDNIYYVTEIMSKVEVNSLIKAADVFVSLHRAEGFGLVMAEAMLNGTPVIATNWSSNTEFMNENVACMVDYKFTKLENDCPPYKKGAVWADPDVCQAAAFMKKLYSDRDFYHQLSDDARAFISEKLGMAKAVSLIEKRIEKIYKKD